MKKLYLLFTLVLALLLSIRTLALPKLNSLPGSSSVIFLDFDGHYVYSSVWNGGAPLICAASGMTDTQITEVFNRTAEDYRPFDINITTDSVIFLAAPIAKRIRIIITPTSGWFPGVGGVAYIGSFIWGDDSPAFVFCDRLGPNSPKFVGECCSHESGHTLGLSHQSKYGSDCISPIEQYNSGIGSGVPGWAPIMGNSYYRNMSNWNNGPTPYGCTNIQDNLSLITSLNGFGYRADDYSEILNGTTTTLTAGNFTKDGIISTNSDIDAFKFSITQNSSFHLTAVPFNVGADDNGANLDIKIELYNNAGTLINTYDPDNTLSVTVDTVLNTGTYYIKIDGSGNINIGEYGSIGAYTLTGTGATLPIHEVILTGNTDNKKHNLAWKIIADDPISDIVIETSADGTDFKSLSTVKDATKYFSCSPFQSIETYYRLKVISVFDQVVYSNTVVLKSLDKAGNIFKVTTLAHNEITINAPVGYHYFISDINGKIINRGTGNTGTCKINISHQPKGMYIIQLTSSKVKQTERIIKQ